LEGHLTRHWNPLIKLHPPLMTCENNLLPFQSGIM
jgi:hypothetical protein